MLQDKRNWVEICAFPVTNFALFAQIHNKRKIKYKIIGRKYGSAFGIPAEIVFMTKSDCDYLLFIFIMFN